MKKSSKRQRQQAQRASADVKAVWRSTMRAVRARTHAVATLQQLNQIIAMPVRTPDDQRAKQAASRLLPRATAAHARSLNMVQAGLWQLQSMGVNWTHLDQEMLKVEQQTLSELAEKRQREPVSFEVDPGRATLAVVNARQRLLR